MAYDDCFFCEGRAADTCPSCFGTFSRMASCGKCKGTGCYCSMHGANWVGASSCPAETRLMIDEWLASRLNSPWDGDETCVGLPYNELDELKYIALSADWNASRPRLSSGESRRTIRWMISVRDLAINTGGFEPEILRAGPMEISRPV